MSVSTIIDYIASAIANTNYGFSSYLFSDINDTSVKLTINLLSTLNPYNNLNQVNEIRDALEHFINERNYKISAIDNQQTDDIVIIHITLKSIRGKLIKAHKTVTFWYDSTN